MVSLTDPARRSPYPALMEFVSLTTVEKVEELTTKIAQETSANAMGDCFKLLST